MPWKSLSQDSNYYYISSDSLPAGVLLLDPSKLQLLDVAALWRHWFFRQKDNIQGLVFLHAKQEDIRREDQVAPGPSKEPGFVYVDPDELGGEDDVQDLNAHPHPESPAAHATSEESKVSFLRRLADDPVYNKFVDLVNSRKEVGVCSVTM